MNLVARVVASILFSVLVIFLAIEMPLQVSAVGSDADLMCLSCKTENNPKDPRIYCPLVRCFDRTSGFLASDGNCVATGICLSKSTGGSSITGIADLLGGIAKLMQALNAGQSPSGGAGSGSGGGTGGCSSYYQVSTPSTDPCAYYVPQTSNSIATGSTTGTGSGNSASDLLNALGNSNNLGNTTGNTNISTNINTNANASTATATAVVATTTGNRSSSTVLFIRQQSNLTPGLSGDIRVSQNGATLIISNPNAQKNTIVAGFLGTNVSGTFQPQGVVQGWCQNRPWVSNFLSFIIPATFFDNLCTLRGYRVGPPPAPTAPAVSLTQTKIIQKPAPKPVATTTAATSTKQNLPPPQVDIWAVPASVPLGTRTTVFWSSKNTVSCLVKSPNGSFNQTTLSGGGATVPLSGVTTFTISCEGADGTHATDFVTVGLSL